jgi:hypothetical protein
MKKCSYCGRDNTDEALHCNECGTEFEREVMDSESDNGGLHDEVKTVTIRTFTTHDAANIARSNLEAHGIECWVNADDCGGMYPNLTAPGGVRLDIRASDAEAAIVLLNAEASPTEINQIETEAATSAPPEIAPLKGLAWVQILFGIVIGVILCLLYQSVNNFGTKTYYHHVHGKVDKEWVYRNGQLAEFLEDRNLDGAWDHWVHYNEYGQVSSSEYDNNFDGKVDETWTYSNGTLISMQKDTDFNGVPDEFCTYKYGILQQMDIKPNGAKFATQRWLYQNGVLVEILRGSDSNGNFKEAVKYDPFFNPISINAATEFQLLSPSPK